MNSMIILKVNFKYVTLIYISSRSMWKKYEFSLLQGSFSENLQTEIYCITFSAYIAGVDRDNDLAVLLR